MQTKKLYKFGYGFSVYPIGDLATYKSKIILDVLHSRLLISLPGKTASLPYLVASLFEKS
jgi:hypothetical protein